MKSSTNLTGTSNPARFSAERSGQLDPQSLAVQSIGVLIGIPAFIAGKLPESFGSIGIEPLEMHLHAEHFDGFSEHLVTWVLEAAHGTAIIEASWRGKGGRTEQVFEMAFPDSRIQACADALAKLKPEYDGHVDDFPHHWLAVTVGDCELTTKVSAGINWPEEDKASIEAFMSVWRPLSRDVEKLLAIPGRYKKRK